MLLEKDGFIVNRTKTFRCACYLIESNGKRVLIDTSLRFEKRAVLKCISADGTRRIDAIFLTHCHSDHVANAQSLSALYDCPIYVSEPGLPMLQNGACRMPKGTNPFSRLICWLEPRIPFYRFSRFPACPQAQPLTDAVVKSYLGEQAALLNTPGHSANSVSIVLGRSIALVGDAMVNAMGRVFPPFADEPESVLTSWKTLLETNCEVFCPAHGAPIKRERLLAMYRKQKSNETRI